MANAADEDALIERLSKAFAPFLRAPVEAAPPGQETVLKEDVSKAKKIAIKQERYLKALQANDAARARWAELSSSHNAESHLNQRSSQMEDRASLKSHLELLKLRRSQRKVSIIDDHVSQLDKEAAEDKILDIAPMQTTLSISDDSLATSTTKIEELKLKAATLIGDLELAVLRAQHELQQGKILLNHVKQRQSARTGESHADQNKLKAVSATRDELVRWIEERISTDPGDEDRQDESAEMLNSNGELQKHKISELYEDYVNARTRLLEVSVAAIAPLPSDRTSSDVTEPRNDNIAVTGSRSAELLPFIENQLWGHLQQQDANIVTQQFISSCLSKERDRTLESLERLSDESHLLHLGADPKTEVSTKGTAFENAENPAYAKSNDAILQRAEAWASAGLEARSLSTKDIESHVADGRGSVELAEASLTELEAFLAQRKRKLGAVGAND